jgi:hypothetical protein
VNILFTSNSNICWPYLKPVKAARQQDQREYDFVITQDESEKFLEKSPHVFYVHKLPKHQHRDAKDSDYYKKDSFHDIFSWYVNVSEIKNKEKNNRHRENMVCVINFF